MDLMSYLLSSVIYLVQRLWKQSLWNLLSRFCFIMQVSNEEAKKVEISKLQKMLEALNLELDAAKLAKINECNKNAVLQNQFELSVKEKSALKRELVAVDELRKENAQLKVLHYCWMNAFHWVCLTVMANKYWLFSPYKNSLGRILYLVCGIKSSFHYCTKF